VQVLTDITENKETQARLADERRLLLSLINHLPDSIYVKDPQGRYVIDNLAHQRIVGAEDGQSVVGKRVFDYFPEDIARRYEDDDQEVLTSQQSVINREEVVVDRQGRRMWHLATKVPLRGPAGEGDAGGKVEGVVCINRDVTEQRLIQDALA